MSSAVIAKLGIIFLATGVCATFLMYWLWGFPFDKETRTSAAPKSLMYTHRALGYIFAITYVAIMWYMVPRMWEYQVEFPARTVAHIILGITIGFLLIIKISIMRFFRHFEEWMPYLGTALLLCAVLLIGLSVPFVFRESALASTAPGGSVYSQKSLERVARLLPTAGLPERASLIELATADALSDGREVLLSNCVKCHDLRTVLLRPRPPASWYRTVSRMAEKPALFSPISEKEQWTVTAYLIAITPDLQRSAKQIREQEQKMKKLAKAADALADEDQQPDGSGDKTDGSGDQTDDESDGTGDQTDDESDGTGDGTDGSGDDTGEPKKLTPEQQAAAKEAYEEECSQCHELSDVDNEPPGSVEEIDELIERMIENEMEVEPDLLELIKWHLRYKFVDKKG